jgi:hypothetical protein
LVGGTPLDTQFFQNVAKGIGAAGIALYIGRDWQRRRMAYELSEILHGPDMLEVRQELWELMTKARLLKSMHGTESKKPVFSERKDAVIRRLPKRDQRLKADGIHLEGYFVLKPEVEDKSLSYDSKVVLNRQLGQPFGRDQKREDFATSHALSRMVYFVCRIAQLHRNGMVHRGMVAKLLGSFFSHYRLALLEFAESYGGLSDKLGEKEDIRVQQDVSSIPDNIRHFFQMLGMSLQLDDEYRYFSKHEDPVSESDSRGRD